MTEREVVGYRDRNGKPIDALEWARLWEDFEGYRQIAETSLPGGGKVITVWNGIVSPVVEGLFFTAVWNPEGALTEEIPTNTEADARAMHAATVERHSA